MLEFVVYNTPGAHGLTPRDIDRRWSIATPLERLLQTFQVNELEPVSEYLSELFKNYRALRTYSCAGAHGARVSKESRLS